MIFFIHSNKMNLIVKYDFILTQFYARFMMVDRYSITELKQPYLKGTNIL